MDRVAESHTAFWRDRGVMTTDLLVADNSHWRAEGLNERSPLWRNPST